MRVEGPGSENVCYNQTMWYLYILKCNDGKLYVGITTDVTKRIERHNQKKASRYTRMRLPVEPVYQEPHPDKSSAR
ncbi:GIY-YIG nuclease family protein, partial [Patescibacteria group bacterium]|nr:GIY-YIG nuclease family protein [Patescibacteria group bacterium]